MPRPVALLGAVLTLGLGAGADSSGLGLLPASWATSAGGATISPATTASPVPVPGPAAGPLLGGPGLSQPGVVADPAPGLAAPPPVEAPAWLLADAGSGDVLAARDAHVPRPPASTLKLLTAVTLLPALQATDTYTDTYTATDADVRVDGSRVGLVPGQSYTVDQLAHGLLIASGNDAAHALAEMSGGQAAALEAMNAEARRLGALRTKAATPHGLDAPGQASTAYDLAVLARAVLDDPWLARLVATRTYEFPGLDGTTYQIQNKNRLLGAYPGSLGLKTGFTTVAGHTLVAAADRDGRRLVAVVLGGEQRAEPMAQRLLDWGFSADAGAARPVGRLLTSDEAAAEVAAQAAAQVTAAAQAAAQVTAAEEQAAASNRQTPEDESLIDAATETMRQHRPAGVPWFWVAIPVGVLVAVLLRRRGSTSRGRYAGD